MPKEAVTLYNLVTERKLNEAADLWQEQRRFAVTRLADADLTAVAEVDPADASRWASQLWAMRAYAAWMQGRISLNPLRHIDPVGTILLPLLCVAVGGFLFGYLTFGLFDPPLRR